MRGSVKVVVEVELSEHEYAALKKMADSTNSNYPGGLPFSVDDIAYAAIAHYIYEAPAERAERAAEKEGN